MVLILLLIFYPIYKVITPHPLDFIYGKPIDDIEDGELAGEDQRCKVH